MTEAGPGEGFTPSQKEQIGSVALNIRVAGGTLAALSIISLLAGLSRSGVGEGKVTGAELLVSMLLLILPSVVSMALAIWMLRGADSCRKFAAARENEGQLLVDGLVTLGNMFLFLCVLHVLGMVALCVQMFNKS